MTFQTRRFTWYDQKIEAETRMGELFINRFTERRVQPTSTMRWLPLWSKLLCQTSSWSLFYEIQPKGSLSFYIFSSFLCLLLLRIISRFIIYIWWRIVNSSPPSIEPIRIKCSWWQTGSCTTTKHMMTWNIKLMPSLIVLLKVCCISFFLLFSILSFSLLCSSSFLSSRFWL